MNIKDISKISNLIIWNHKDLENNFTNKEIISFFVEIGIERTEIISFVWALKTPRRWLPAFLKDLYDNRELIEVLTNLSDKISFYNPEFKNLILEFIWEENFTKNLVKKIWFLTPFDSWKDKKLKIFEEITKETDWNVETFDIYGYWDDNFLWWKLKNFLNDLSIFIVDLRNSNKNVLLELWYILALNKETIVIIPEWEKVPSDLNWIVYIREWKVDVSWTAEDFQKFKDNFEKDLKNAIEEKIKELNKFTF